MAGETAATSLPFNEAIDFFRQKVRLPTRAWTDLWEGMHARAFVVAGATRDSLIADFQSAVLKALQQGTTLETFRQDFDKIVGEHGWDYKGGRDWRSRVIFNTNIRTAYAAGRWQQIERNKAARPYLRYVAVMDERTRPEHRAWHGTILPVDHEWWETHYPPNGWNCRCTAVSVSADEIERNGWEVSEDAPPVKLETRAVNTPEGPVALRVPEGIDTGFGYNVGEAAWGRGAENLAQDRHGAWERLEAPGAAAPADELPVDRPRARLGRRARDEEDLRRLLRDAIGGDQKIFNDPTGTRLGIGQALADHTIARHEQDGREVFFPFIPELIESPAEIWVGFSRSKETGRVTLRRRYVKLIALDKNQSLGLIADADNGVWSGLTFFRGRAGGLSNLRWGLRAYRRGGA